MNYVHIPQPILENVIQALKDGETEKALGVLNYCLEKHFTDEQEGE